MQVRLDHLVVRHIRVVRKRSERRDEVGEAVHLANRVGVVVSTQGQGQAQPRALPASHPARKGPGCKMRSELRLPSGNSAQGSWQCLLHCRNPADYVRDESMLIHLDIQIAHVGAVEVHSEFQVMRANRPAQIVDELVLRDIPALGIDIAHAAHVVEPDPGAKRITVGNTASTAASSGGPKRVL